MKKKEFETFCPTSPAAWRQWLEKYHQSKDAIWLVYYRVRSAKTSLTWSEAVDEALCFGWIDSTKKTIDNERYMQYFCKRKPTSTWSKINKDKVTQLVGANKMQKAGLAAVARAKENGTWTLLDAVEQLIVPADLAAEFSQNPAAAAFYQQQNKSTQKGLLYWLVMAKRANTREKRLEAIVFNAAKGELPKGF